MSRVTCGFAARAACVLAAWLLLAGCGSRREASCRFGAEQSVFTSHALVLDDMALTRRGAKQVAVFSDASGLYVRELSALGLPLSAAVRVAERCAGGVDAAVDRGRLMIACLQPADVPAQAQPNEAVVLYTLDATNRVTRTQRFGHAGSRSHGVSMVLLASRVLVAFQDAVVGEGRAWLADVPLGVQSEPAIAPRLISDPAWVANAPSLAVRGEQVLATWVEMGNGGDAALGRVMVSEVQRPRAPSVLVQTRSLAPSPQLVSLGDRWMLAFRDSRESRRKTGLYLVALDSDAHVMGDAVRVARSDSQGRPMLRACARGLVVATPRTFGGDDFVGAVGVDHDLRHISGEQQFYQDDREFAQVTGACSDSEALLLIGERGKPGRSHAALRALPFTCR